jgi:hypothetical protein
MFNNVPAVSGIVTKERFLITACYVSYFNIPNNEDTSQYFARRLN